MAQQPRKCEAALRLSDVLEELGGVQVWLGRVFRDSCLSAQPGLWLSRQEVLGKGWDCEEAESPF